MIRSGYHIILRIPTIGIFDERTGQPFLSLCDANIDQFPNNICERLLANADCTLPKYHIIPDKPYKVWWNDE